MLGTLFANKVVKVTSDLLLERTVVEYKTLAKLRHPHIVKVYALILEPATQMASLLMDFLPGKSLGQLLNEGHEFTGRTYVEMEVKTLAGQLLSVLVYLTSEGLVHRDINPSNIILTGSHATLIDFQTVCAVSPSSPQGVTGTRPYQAPEMWLPSSYGCKSDVWALGLVLERLLRSSVCPASAEAVQLVTWCLQSDPEERCSAVQALQSSWLQQSDFHKF